MEEISNEDVGVSKRLLLKKAREFLLINDEDDENALRNLGEALKSGKLEFPYRLETNKRDMLVQEHQKIELQIRKLKSFNSGYGKYKDQLSKEGDSLKPIEYIKQFIGNIENEEYKQFIAILEKEYSQIKALLIDKMPFETDIGNKLKDLSAQLDNLKKNIDACPNIISTPISDSDRYIALGEIKSEYFQLLSKPENKSIVDEKIKNKIKELEEYKSQFIDYNVARERTINALNDYINTYMKLAKSAFESYNDYVPNYDYKNRILTLRKNKTSEIEARTSSSVDLFRHLCLFLGLHEMIINIKVPYVAPLLILDQPTRPYFQANKNIDYTKTKNNTDAKGDWHKVEEIFLILDTFISNIMNSNGEMQVIVLEHVSKDAWHGKENVHLVEEFDGIENALIPPRIANKN